MNTFVCSFHLADAGTVSFLAGSDYNLRVESTTPGPGGHDQLAIEGSLSLVTTGAGVTLALADTRYTAAAAAGDELVIVTNDGTDAVPGTFAGLAEGVSVDIGGAAATISYVGGTGNDIVLTAADDNNNNQPPTGVTLTPSSDTLPENTSTATAIALSTISISDDGLGVNELARSGPDAGSFELVGTTLQLRVGEVLDFETQLTCSVTVDVDDASVGGSPDASATFTLNLANSSELAGIDVQKNQTQRSYVRSLDILFDVGGNDLLDLISDDRIELTRFDLNGDNGTAVTLPNVAAVGNQIQLDFGTQGIGGRRSSNVGDGYYQIALDMDDSGTFESKKFFHRLLGDVTGDGVVDRSDKSQVSAARRRPYSMESDVHGDGCISSLDRSLAFRAVGRKLNDDLFRDD